MGNEEKKVRQRSGTRGMRTRGMVKLHCLFDYVLEQKDDFLEWKIVVETRVRRVRLFTFPY